MFLFSSEIKNHFEWYLLYLKNLTKFHPVFVVKLKSPDISEVIDIDALRIKLKFVANCMGETVSACPWIF